MSRAIRRTAVPPVLLVLAVTGCRPPLPTPELKYRQEREQTVRNELPAKESAHFRGLRFYPFGPAYRFRAMLEPVVPPESLKIAANLKLSN